MGLHPLQIDFSDTELMCAPQVQIGEVTFYFKRLPATESWPLLLRLREDLARSSLALVNTDDQIVSQIFNGLFLLPTERVLFYQNALFRYVEFSTNQVSRQTLEGGEETAFNMDLGIGAFHVFEVLARIFCVNFLESFSSLLADATTPAVEKERETPPPAEPYMDSVWGPQKAEAALKTV